MSQDPGQPLRWRQEENLAKGTYMYRHQPESKCAWQAIKKHFGLLILGAIIPTLVSPSSDSSTCPLRTNTKSALLRLTFSIRSNQANSAQNLPACLSTPGMLFQTLGKPTASRTEVCSPRPEASFPAHPHRYAPGENSHQLGIHKTLLRSSNVQ